ncbi:MAG: MucR family transcriptional regulator [Devosiaceae bacterium]
MDIKQPAHDLETTTQIVSAYVGNNIVPADQLAHLIASVDQALAALSGSATPEPIQPQEPAVSIRKSIADHHLVCLDCGKTFKSLKRHLNTSHGLKPAEYQQKWGLPNDYPMVAPAYAERRSEIAKNLGLGRRADDS